MTVVGGLVFWSAVAALVVALAWVITVAEERAIERDERRRAEASESHPESVRRADTRGQVR